VFRFEYSLNDDDYLKFSEYTLTNGAAWKRTVRLNRLSVFFVFMVFSVIFWIVSSGYMVAVWGTVCSMSAAVIISVKIKSLIIAGLRSNVARLKKDGKLPYGKFGSVCFNDELITDTTPESQTKTGYQMVERIAVTAEAIYVYISSTQAHIIPNGVFSG